MTPCAKSNRSRGEILPRRRLRAGLFVALIAIGAVTAQSGAQTANTIRPADRVAFAGFAFDLPEGGRWMADRGVTEGVRYLHLQRQTTSVKLRIEVTSRRPKPPIASEQELLTRVGQNSDGAAVPDRDRGAVCARIHKEWQDEMTVATKGSGGKHFGTGVFAEMDDYSLVCLHPRAKGTVISFRFVARMRAGLALEPHGDEARAFFESVRFDG